MDAAGAKHLGYDPKNVAPAVRQERPPKWPRDSHALRLPAPGLRPFASAAFGKGDRLGILRVQGALVIHVVLHDNNTAVLKEPPGWCLNFIRDLQSNFLGDLLSKITTKTPLKKRAPLLPIVDLRRLTSISTVLEYE